MLCTHGTSTFIYYIIYIYNIYTARVNLNYTLFNLRTHSSPRSKIFIKNVRTHVLDRSRGSGELSPSATYTNIKMISLAMSSLVDVDAKARSRHAQEQNIFQNCQKCRVPLRNHQAHKRYPCYSLYDLSQRIYQR